MDFSNISKSTPVEPYIELDGGFARCHRCWTEIRPTDDICPKCTQKQDWSWFRKTNKDKEVST